MKKKSIMSLFVRNSKKSELLFIRNTISATTRNESLDGKDYLVVPCVMIVEGVHNGSQGALFYSSEELKKFTCCWNMKPVLLRHPDIEESGTNLDVLKHQGVGIIMNTEYVDNKLKTEIWLDVTKANSLDSRIVERIENKEKVEVSTGLFTELSQTPGVWNKKEYQSVALNFRPDHLAILLDEKGACSIADGAGLLANKAVLKNELSHYQINETLRQQLEGNESNKDVWYWVPEVFSKYFIYEKELAGDREYYRQDYSVSSEDVVTIIGLPTKVKRTVEYKPTTNKEAEMLTKEQIEALIANGSYKKGDQEFLETLSEAQIQMLSLNYEKKEEEKEEEEEEKETKNSSSPVADSVKNAKEVTVESFLKNAPEAIKAVINQGIDSYKKSKTEAIEKITSNKNCTFTKEILETKTVTELEMIASLVAPAPQTVTNEVVDIPVLKPQTLFAPQAVTNEIVASDLPTLNTTPMFPKED